MTEFKIGDEVRTYSLESSRVHNWLLKVGAVRDSGSLELRTINGSFWGFISPQYCTLVHRPEPAQQLRDCTSQADDAADVFAGKPKGYTEPAQPEPQGVRWFLDSPRVLTAKTKDEADYFTRRGYTECTVTGEPLPSGKKRTTKDFGEYIQHQLDRDPDLAAQVAAARGEDALLKDLSEDEIEEAWHRCIKEHAGLAPHQYFRIAMGMADPTPEQAAHIDKCEKCRKWIDNYKPTPPATPLTDSEKIKLTFDKFLEMSNMGVDVTALNRCAPAATPPASGTVTQEFRDAADLEAETPITVGVTLPSGEKRCEQQYCDRCDGTGWYEGGAGKIMTDCERCNGTGVVSVRPIATAMLPSGTVTREFRDAADVEAETPITVGTTPASGKNKTMTRKEVWGHCQKVYEQARQATKERRERDAEEDTPPATPPSESADKDSAVDLLDRLRAYIFTLQDQLIAARLEAKPATPLPSESVERVTEALDALQDCNERMDIRSNAGILHRHIEQQSAEIEALREENERLKDAIRKQT